MHGGFVVSILLTFVYASCGSDRLECHRLFLITGFPLLIFAAMVCTMLFGCFFHTDLPGNLVCVYASFSMSRYYPFYRFHPPVKLAEGCGQTMGRILIEMCRGLCSRCGEGAIPYSFSKIATPYLSILRRGNMAAL
jgi:hypothetical protein